MTSKKRIIFFNLCIPISTRSGLKNNQAECRISELIEVRSDKRIGTGYRIV
jgi:hypothetical protein